jgi:predicted Zn-dependent protease
MPEARARAERALRRALELDSGLHEARIRLAHVLHDRGRHADAVRELEHVPVGTLPVPLGYYALVVAGQAQRALDRLGESRTAFEHALSLVPGAQIPRLALSEIALARGERDLAIRHVADLSGEAEDPWFLLGRSFLTAESAVRTMRQAFG